MANQRKSPESRAPGNAGRNAAARGETGTDSDRLPGPLGSAGADGDLGGIPRAAGVPDSAGPSGDEDITSDASRERERLSADPDDKAAAQASARREARRERSRELPNESPAEQLARPARNPTHDV
jgi:hypothetical protein